MNTFTKQYEEYRLFFEEKLAAFCAENKSYPAVLAESMNYSLLSGGKRVRPVLFFAGLIALGVDYRTEFTLALALECVHTYSLIHDDLPAMDNDDYRRGRLSNHKKFGEANAILAGDGLLNTACELVLSVASDKRHLKAARILMKCAGAKGMVAGQSADLYYEKREGDEEALRFIYAHKTGKLIAAPLRMAAAIAGKADREMERLGEQLGFLFQLTDDILDEVGSSETVGKTLGKDKAEEKLTGVKIYGLQRARTLAAECAEECMNILKNIPDSEFLEGIVALFRDRDR